MPDVPVHGPACQGVESVVEDGSESSRGLLERTGQVASAGARAEHGFLARKADRRLASRACTQTGGLSSSY